MFVNLQKYPVVLYREDGSILHIPPMDTPPRIFEKYERTVTEDSVPIFKVVSTEVNGLPTIEPENIYIATISVASIVKLPNVVSPMNAARDGTGRILGFRGLKQWA